MLPNRIFVQIQTRYPYLVLCHRCSFAQKAGGTKSVKNVESTIKILQNVDLSSDLVRFLALDPFQLNTLILATPLFAVNLLST